MRINFTFFSQVWRFCLFFLVVIGIGHTAYGQQTVTGKVVDEATNETIPGATVTIKGTNKGTATDVNGVFKLSASAGSIIIVKSVGYQTIELAVTTGRPMMIKMAGNNKALNEVVVVGYGTERKATLTGSVTTVGAKAFQDKGPVDNPLEALQGQVPGAIITRSSAAPGNEGWNIQIRGATSINGSSPLVVIDGVATSDVNALNALNPGDVESISFLKDASAAIYGARAAGGVVLVTTKKGKLGKTVVQYDGSLSRKIVGLQPQLMNVQQWASELLQARQNDGYGATDQWIMLANLMLKNMGGYVDNTIAGNPIPAFGDVKDYTAFNTTWNKVLWGNATSNQQNFSVSGRNEKSGYRLSIGYMNDGSLLRWGDNANKRYNIRFSNDYKLADNVTLESNVALDQDNVVQPTLLTNVLGQYAQPGFPTATINGLPYAWGGQYSPTWEAKLGGDNKSYTARWYLNEKVTYNVVSHLNLVANVAYNPTRIQNNTQQNAIQWYNYTGTLAGNVFPTQANSYYQKSNAADDYYNANAYLEYKNTFAKDHNFGLTIGSQYERDEYDLFSATTYNLANSTVPSLGLGVGDATTKNNAETKNHYAIASAFGRLNYSFKSKYLLEVIGRYDGSSKFAADDRWKLFYGVSGGWRISQESFMQNVKFFDDLKLRASYGIVGNQNGIGLYDYLQLLNVGYSKVVTDNYPIIGTSPVVTVSPTSNLVSTNRTWEKVETTNLALDFAVLHSRLSGTVEAFIKNNANMLIPVVYPAVLGATAPASNSGYLRTKGIEASLNWADKVGRFGYNIGGNLTYNTNKLLTYSGQTAIGPGYNSVVQGYPLNAVFGLEYAGRIQTQQQLTDYNNKYYTGNTIGIPNPVGGTPLRLGDNMYKDVNGDGKLTTADYVYLGSDDPKLSYAFNAGVNYAGFDFNVIFQGVGQRTIFRTGTYRVPFQAVYLGQSAQFVGNTWTPDNTSAYYPKLSSMGTYNNYNYQASSFSVENGAYLRLKNIVLGYTLPSTLLKRSKFISKVRVYISGNDLWESTKIKDGWDPEAPRDVLNGSNNYVGRYPFYRFVTAGVNVTL
jgi:TonB-linked SusC/RagA family outer membrane protein